MGWGTSNDPRQNPSDQMAGLLSRKKAEKLHFFVVMAYALRFAHLLIDRACASPGRLLRYALARFAEYGLLTR
jgi:hypothetical protein